MPKGIYERTKIICKRMSEAKKKNPVRYWLGKKKPPMSEKWKASISKANKDNPKIGHKGKEHWNWKGGTSRGYKEGYYSTEYIKWRTAIFERDSYTCQKCGIKGSKVYITAHHIKSWAKYPKLRFDIDNGLTLCEDCHSMTDNYKGRG